MTADEKSCIKLRFYDSDGFRCSHILIREYFRNLIPKYARLMEVAVNEAVNNAFVYGRTPKGIALTLRVRNNKVVAEVRDYGDGFDFRDHLRRAGKADFAETVLDNVHGRGIFLMKAATDKLSYNSQGNRVRMTKTMPGSTG